MKIKKIFVPLIMLIFILLSSVTVLADNSEPNLTAKSVILIDNRTKKILYCKNENEKMYPASTTKILTAILALEHCNLNDIVTASYDAIMTRPAG